MRHDDDLPDPPAPPPARRRWAAAVVGIGVIGAVIAAVVVAQRDDPDSTPVPGTVDTTAPGAATTLPTPDTTTAPTDPMTPTVAVDGPCITITSRGRTATGCPATGPEFDQVDTRTFVADLDGPVVATSRSGDPLDDLTVAVADDGFTARCRWDELARRVPEGALVEAVVCNDRGVMGLTVSTDADQGDPPSYFTLPTVFVPGGTDLGPGAPVEGFASALAFVAPLPDGPNCTLLLPPDREGWREACGLDAGIALVGLASKGTAEIALPPEVLEIVVADGGLVTTATFLDAMSPSSGCSLDSTRDLVRLTPASSIVTGIGCIGDEASLTTASVLAQDGPPDGSIWSALRDDDAWSIVDQGTGIEDFAFPLVPSVTWQSWPATTRPDFQASWSEPITAIPAQPTVDAFAEQLLTALGGFPTDPEFPLNERLVAVRPDGLPLVVAQVDIGGDDSIAGAVSHVWLQEVFDDTGSIGWRSSEVLTGFVCARGVTDDGELCI